MKKRPTNPIECFFCLDHKKAQGDMMRASVICKQEDFQSVVSGLSATYETNLIWIKPGSKGCSLLSSTLVKIFRSTPIKEIGL